MSKKVIGYILCLVMVASLAIGCSSKETSKQNEGTKNEGTDKESVVEDITIGSVIMNTSGEWFAEVMVGQEDAAKELGVKLEMVSAEDDISTEYDKVDAFVSQGVDALVICPISFESSAAAVDLASEKGIHVVNWNTTVNTDTTSFIGVDASDLGGMTGVYAVDYITENFPDGCKVAIIGNSKYEIGIERVQGFKKEIQELVDSGLIEVVNEQDAEFQEDGFDITEQMLTADPDIDVIWAWNQTSLLGCAAYLNNSKNTDVVVMGTDMSVELAKDMLGDNITLQAITTQQPYELGYQAVTNAYKAVKGEKVEKEVWVPVYTYTKENPDEIQTYIDEHKHLVE